MAWKLLSILSAVCLAAACYFANSNKQRTENEKVRLQASTANLKAAQERKAEGDEAVKVKEELYAAVQKDRDTAKEEVVKLAADAQEKDAALALLKGNLTQVSTQVSQVQKQIDDAGDIESLVAQVEKLRKDQVTAEGAVANQNQRLASVKESIGSITGQINKLKEAEIQGRRGIVAPDFTARVAQYFPEWGFAILNKGNSQGVFANADLEVKRGKDVIAKLKVRSVEQNNAIADVVPGSLAEGNVVFTGDSVIASAQQSAADTKKTNTTPNADGGAPEMPATTEDAPMNSDPFGAPTTPAAPMNSDPFGAPAAAPMGSDPFGAPPAAPAGGAMNSDPFGSAPSSN